jgi:uncharacterized protein
MRKILSNLFSFFLLIIGYCLLVIPVEAVNYPQPVGYVNDFASLFTPEFKTELDSNLSNFAKEQSAEIAVVTVKSLEGIDIETYAVELFEKWGIGKKGADNGVLLLVSKDDRKIRVEVGYGIEPYITDGRAGEIIRNDMAPYFKQDDYEKGVGLAVASIQKYIAGKELAPREAANTGTGSADWIGPLLIFGWVIFTYVGSFLGRTKEIWPGGVIGGILGIIVGLVIGSIAIGLFIGVFGGIFGLIMDAILSRNYTDRKKKGLPTDFFHTLGGFSGSSRSSWGGGGFRSGGGGFGGFGGGRSGGGGASGGW